MNSIIRNIIVVVFTLLLSVSSEAVSQTGAAQHQRGGITDGVTPPRSPQYSGTPNHREIATRALELAIQAGFNDTAGISADVLRARLEAGAYSEDYDLVPGIVGEHFPNPWDQGPTFDFEGLYPFARIPYGSLTDKLSGWSRGMPHGYDPVQGFTWPGTDSTTVEWANAILNTFSWKTALDLYSSGKKADAYECVGHLIHLLSDLSIPEHVKIVDHGMNVAEEHSGTIFNPDLLSFVVDEYELALAGGIELPGVIVLIPDLLGVFRNALATADSAGIPRLGSWQEYFVDLALLTYNDSLVNRYYGAPSVNGTWGTRMNSSGSVVDPTRYGITPPAPIAGRWSQVILKSTATADGGTIIPRSAMVSMCDKLVPEAAEYCAGLLLKFREEAEVVGDVPVSTEVPVTIALSQNYPNPFNPSTTIEYQTATMGHVTLKVFDLLGRKVATLVNDVIPPGEHSVTWDAGELPSGVYLYRIEAGSFLELKTMILMK